jgi:hypothetical protein
MGSHTSTQASSVMRLAFYYPWFPRNWKQQGPDGREISPYTKYHPSLGYYDSANRAIVNKHIDAMKYANIDGGIASWWGQGTEEDRNFLTLLAAAEGRAFTWCIYHELESKRSLTVSDIESDLKYVGEKYAGHPNYLHIDGRFVVFVYSTVEQRAEGCPMASRWKQANTVNAFIVLKVFKDYGSWADQPDSWHQYAPAKSLVVCRKGRILGKTYSCTISPGFWWVVEHQPKLGRDLGGWRASIREMIASKAMFQLIATFNEHGEGTGVESCSEWESKSGYGAYLDALHLNGKS